MNGPLSKIRSVVQYIVRCEALYEFEAGFSNKLFIL